MNTKGLVQRVDSLSGLEWVCVCVSRMGGWGMRSEVDGWIR